jgi:hypothetical protein
VRAASRCLPASCRRFLFPCPGTGPESLADVRDGKRIEPNTKFPLGDQQMAPRLATIRKGRISVKENARA